MKQLLLKFFGELGDFLAVLLKSGVQDELKALLPIALNAVKTVAADPTLTTGDAKFNAAFALIGDQLGDKQATIGKSLVNLAIELAVQRFKDMQPK
jgi:hypothetical protein